MTDEQHVQQDFALVRKAGDQTAAFIKKHLKPTDPLRGPLIAVVVLLALSSFVSLVYFILRSRLFDVLFIIVLVVLLGLALALIWVAAYPGQPSGQKRKDAQRIVLVVIALGLLAAWTTDLGSNGLMGQLRFSFHYLRLCLGAARLDDFVDGLTHDELPDQVESLDAFEINQVGAVATVPGIEPGGTLSKQSSLLRALAMNRTLTITGIRRVAKPWQTGTILVAAKTIELDGAEIEIGRHTLVLVANDIVVHSTATIRAFARRTAGAPAPTYPNGSGFEGLDAGDVHLLVFGSVSGTLTVELAGEDGGPGAPGQYGKDAATDQIHKPQESDGVGTIRPISLQELQVRRDSYKNPSRQVREQQDNVISICGNRCLITECTHTASAGEKGTNAITLPADQANGKPGGKGGAAGRLFIYARRGHWTNVRGGIVFDPSIHARGGRGGLAGHPGRGSPGGKRLPTGPLDPFGICTRGSDGPAGDDGLPASEGQDGADGQASPETASREILITTLLGGSVQ
jgi:hypothetical protein